MSKYLYADDTTAANAAQISADSGEIVHLHCADENQRSVYAAELGVLLDDADEFGGGDAELEIVGEIDGSPVRVHLSLP